MVVKVLGAAPIITKIPIVWFEIVMLRLKRVAFYAVPHYSRYGAYAQAVFVILYLLLFNLWPHIPGIAIGFLGLEAVIITLRAGHETGHEKFGKVEQVIWLLIAFTLFYVDARTTIKDREQHELGEHAAKQSESQQFQSITNGLEATVNQAQRHFEETIKKEEANAGLERSMINQFTGGTTYPEVFGINYGTRFPLLVVAIGKYNLSDIDIYVRSHVQRSDPESVMSSFSNVLTAHIPMIHAKDSMTTPITLVPKDEIDEYQIDITARNGNFLEMLKFVKDKEGKYEEDCQITDWRGHFFRRFKQASATGSKR